jgi:hypothetical protein
MPAQPPPAIRRRARTYAGMVIYSAGFVLLLLVVWHSYLAPAIDAAKHADFKGKQTLQAVSWLMLSVVLAYLLMGWVLVFRIGRFFFPRPGPGPKRTQTKYIDVWAEAGKRMKEKGDDEERGED